MIHGVIWGTTTRRLAPADPRSCFRIRLASVLCVHREQRVDAFWGRAVGSPWPGLVGGGLGTVCLLTFCAQEHWVSASVKPPSGLGFKSVTWYLGLLVNVDNCNLTLGCVSWNLDIEEQDPWMLDIGFNCSRVEPLAEDLSLVAQCGVPGRQRVLQCLIAELNAYGGRRGESLLQP